MVVVGVVVVLVLVGAVVSKGAVLQIGRSLVRSQPVSVDFSLT